MPRTTSREGWGVRVADALGYRDRVLGEIAALSAEQGVSVALAGDSALMMNGLTRFVTTRSTTILVSSALKRPPSGVVMHDVAHASEVRLYWSALARAAQAPDFAIPIVRKEHLVALAMLERDWEAFDCIVGSMVPFRRRTVRRIILRDLGSRAARLFDVAVARSVGVASRGRGGSRATRGS